MTNIAIFVSGNGSNCENIIRHFNSVSTAKVTLVLSNHADAFALTRACNLGIKTETVSREDVKNPEVMLPLLDSYNISFIVLAGFMQIIPDYIIKNYPNRIINIHPSLLPKYGGKGMYGRHVHEAVKAAGETETGITIHYVTEICDGGGIIAQFKTPVNPDDTAEDIESKVHQLEKLHFPSVIEKTIGKDL
ncbi:MAG: phosphoribosylglycinamide formyltransferase [Prevotella sp.]